MFHMVITFSFHHFTIAFSFHHQVTQPPTDDRLLLINQITDAVINAHMATTVGTRAKVNEAFERLSTNPDKSSSAMVSPLSNILFFVFTQSKFKSDRMRMIH